MSDLFKIRNIDAELEVGDVKYRFCDPIFEDKIDLLKRSNALTESKDKMDQLEYIEKRRSLNVESIKQYLPSLPDEVISKIGTHSMNALFEHVSKLAEDGFGAIVEKVSKN